MQKSAYAKLALFATILALGVVLLGAYVRLSDAGLGCPDWPGCYGKLVVPKQADAIAAANAAYPERPVEPDKGWKEMVHRYFAGALGLAILALALLAWKKRRQPGQPLVLPVMLVGLVIFQSILGMWTVTWQLKPVVVMGHLLGGMATLSLLWLLFLRSRPSDRAAVNAAKGLKLAAAAAVVVLVAQIALGGWTSSNYAALACTDFPTCHGEWWPEADFEEAFVLWRGLGMNYEFGILDNPARVAIQLTHRIGALVTVTVLGALALALLVGRRAPMLRSLGAVVGVLLCAQFGLGVANVLLSLPLPVAVAHNGVAAILLLSLVTLNYTLHRREAREPHHG